MLLAMTDTIDIKPDELTIVRAILQKYLPDTSKVWVFGSRATGKAKRFSDLDLAVDAGRPLTLSEQARISDAFTESPLPWRVDIVDMQTVSDRFRHIIDEQKVPLPL